MKKILLSLAVIIGFSAYAFLLRFRTDDDVHVIPPASNPTTDINTATTIPMMPNGQAMMATKYRDGEYTGNVADAYYGNMQVKVIIKNGRLSDVQFLQYPNDRHTSVQINQEAMPYLKSEAISAQSANVDIISGATQSSRGFRESLKTALAQAT